jgi:predicted O-methyltransferase YrrM
MTKLNTGWKHWDMYLSKFVGKKINCLDIGSYKGDSTCWMLNNICTNPYSRVYSLDTWEGSPEYGNYTNEIEKVFDENVGKTGRKSQNIKMKTTSTKGLLQLNNSNKIIFDFIFIDASHEAKDVLSDGVLSWSLLNNEGILIFDDYKWKKLKKEYFRPKIAIDSFVSIYKPQLKTLYIGYQYIIEKINERDYEKPELEDYYKTGIRKLL